MLIHGWSPEAVPVLSPSEVVYFVLLPEPLPAPNGHTVHVPMPPLDQPVSAADRPTIDSTVMLRFWQIQTISGVDGRALQALDAAMRQVLPPGLLPDPFALEAVATTDDPASLDTYRTAVEMRAYVSMLAESSILTGFERACAALREMHRAYRVATRTQVRPLTTQKLHQLVPFATADLNGQWHPRTGWVVAHPRLPHPVAPENLPGADVSQIEYYMDALRRAHPRALYWERMLPAYAAFDDGDYTAATLEAAIAIEMLIDAALAVALWDSGESVKVAYDQSREGIVKRVRMRLPQALNDAMSLWSPHGDGPAARWKRNLADVRNVAIHRGRPVQRDEAFRAIEAAEQLDALIVERMLAAADRLPRAALVLLGQPALQRAGRWTPRVQAMAGFDWLDIFRDWQESIDLDDDRGSPRRP